MFEKKKRPGADRDSHNKSGQVWTLTVLWTLKSDSEAMSLSSSSVADVAEGFAELEPKRRVNKWIERLSFIDEMLRR